tara:strand:- start:654 stop:1193 length:540 start_codon:yes stop_codon:yes gene_type:complete
MNSNLKIIFAPSNTLRKVSREVEPEEFGEDLDAFMDKMLEKMYLSNGVGLAGIQVGDDRRILVADAGFGPVKMVNPEVLEASDEKISYTEGCLSLPDLEQDVERSKYIKLIYKTPLGEVVDGTLSDIYAVVIQHEIDHLNGQTLLNKMSRLKKDMYLKKLKKKRRMGKKLLKSLRKYGY